MTSNKHENYEILNLIGYGLAKFDKKFIHQFNCTSKSQFYQKIVELKVAETIGTVKNRQDLFDPFFENERRGWWQKGNTYIHRKIFIDSLFGEYGVVDFASIIKLYIRNNFKGVFNDVIPASPILKTKFKQLQATGKEAEHYFLENFQSIENFSNGSIEDARLFGDGYDFQIEHHNHFYLVEVKGIRAQKGAFRMTENEYFKAEEYRNDYGLVIVSNLEEMPKMTVTFNPLSSYELIKKSSSVNQISYHSPALKW